MDILELQAVVIDALEDIKAQDIKLFDTVPLTSLFDRVAVVSGDDVLGGARFADAIGLNAWPVETHLAGRIEWAFPRDPDNSHKQLPWRMLVPLRVGNLLVAGRCAGMEHLGQSAARASGACFVMGQAAGTAAGQDGPFGLEADRHREPPAGVGAEDHVGGQVGEVGVAAQHGASGIALLGRQAGQAVVGQYLDEIALDRAFEVVVLAGAQRP